eukprot:2752033-Prymnesium_polylepis.1
MQDSSSRRKRQAAAAPHAEAAAPPAAEAAAPTLNNPPPAPPARTHGFPVLLLTKSRPDYLNRTLTSLLAVRGVERERVFVVQDGADRAVARLVRRAGLRLAQHQSASAVSESRGSRIAAAYKYALSLAFDVLTSDEAIVVAEDDLLFSPDAMEPFAVVRVGVERQWLRWDGRRPEGAPPHRVLPGPRLAADAFAVQGRARGGVAGRALGPLDALRAQVPHVAPARVRVPAGAARVPRGRARHVYGHAQPRALLCRHSAQHRRDRAVAIQRGAVAARRDGPRCLRRSAARAAARRPAAVGAGGAAAAERHGRRAVVHPTSARDWQHTLQRHGLLLWAVARDAARQPQGRARVSLPWPPRAARQHQGWPVRRAVSVCEARTAPKATAVNESGHVGNQGSLASDGGRLWQGQPWSEDRGCVPSVDGTWSNVAVGGCYSDSGCNVTPTWGAPRVHRCASGAATREMASSV